jgi:hypothetical protein
VKWTLTGGLVGTVSATPVALARGPWWAVLVSGLAGDLTFLAAGLLYLASLRMTYQEIRWLAKLPYTGSFKGAGGIEMNVPSGPTRSEPDPLRSIRWVRRKPPPDS